MVNLIKKGYLNGSFDEYLEVRVWYSMRFTDVEKGKIAALVDLVWGAKRFSRYYKWSKISVLRYVKEYRENVTIVKKGQKLGKKAKNFENY